MSFWRNGSNSLINFTADDGPRYAGEHAAAPAAADGRLKVISWNIKFAARIGAALEELRRVPALQEADLILLQEMDDEGVARMARQLNYNYVYYPASIHNRTGRPFGNAVLSSWPIRQSCKLLLPHASPTNGQRRIAVGAVLQVGQQRLAAYSVHTETPVLSHARRAEQIAELRDRVRLVPADHVIVGGDFNTFSPRSARMLRETMAGAGLAPVFDGHRGTRRPATIRTPLATLASFKLDHLFVRGARPLASGVWPNTAASDHYPLWATLEVG
jgi:endonuclease/exonuclease/phosphatase family metal-dependent hydrolase